MAKKVRRTIGLLSLAVIFAVIFFVNPEESRPKDNYLAGTLAMTFWLGFSLISLLGMVFSQKNFWWDISACITWGLMMVVLSFAPPVEGVIFSAKDNFLLGLWFFSWTIAVFVDIFILLFFSKRRNHRVLRTRTY